MNIFLIDTFNCFLSLVAGLEDIHMYIYIVPVLVFIEMPLYMLIIISFLKTICEETFLPKNKHLGYFPKVTCIVSCYNEGEAVGTTIKSLTEQIYKGMIEIFVIIDDAAENRETCEHARRAASECRGNIRRNIVVIPKKTRGGLVSSRNLGLKLSTGRIIIVIDGDSSCDNDMVFNMTRNFYDKNIAAVSGFLRVRNLKKNLLTRLQGMEYIHGIQIGKMGLGKMNIINNVSGAFGAFEKRLLEKMGGWRNGTAEDLDLTLRIKSLWRRYPKMKITYDHKAIIHTDVPETVKDIVKQRLRWDGDLVFIYFFRYWKLIKPKFLGVKVFLGLFWYNILFCVVAPVATVLYLFYLIVCFPFPYVVAVFIFLYLYYFMISFIMYTIYLIGISERKLLDFLNIWLIVLFPIYQFLMRFVSTTAFFIELTLQTHKNSNMAPWWVLKKTEGK